MSTKHFTGQPTTLNVTRGGKVVATLPAYWARHPFTNAWVKVTVPASSGLGTAIAQYGAAVSCAIESTNW